MPNAEPESRSRAINVSVSNIAANMLSSLFHGDSSKVKKTLKSITMDIDDSTKVKKIQGYDNIFVARGDGMRIVFQRDDDVVVIISVSADP
jgi:mRNA-degrading endonuclease RelE of RelBE toxin-antitoxin system